MGSDRLDRSRVLWVFLFDTSNVVVLAVLILGFTAGWNVLGRSVMWVMLVILLLATGRQLLTLAHLSISAKFRQEAQTDSSGFAQGFYISQTNASFRRLLAVHLIFGCIVWAGLMVFTWLLTLFIGKPKPFFGDSLTMALAVVGYFYFARSWDVANGIAVHYRK